MQTKRLKLVYCGLLPSLLWNSSLCAQVQLGGDIDGETTYDQSSYSIALDGNRLAIGAPYNDGNGIDAGHVRVYEWSGSAWKQLGADIDGAAFSDESGYSVALSGDRVAVGAPENDDNGTDAGHVRVYEWSGSAWKQLGADIAGEAQSDKSGHAVALDGNRLAIGAPHNDGANSVGVGHVRVYEWSGSAWKQLGADIDGEKPIEASGHSVSLSGDRIAIGAPGSNENGIDAGRVRVYEWDGNAWKQLGTGIDGEAKGDESGRFISLHGDRLAIGSPDNKGSSDRSGHVRVYEWSGSAWVQLGADIDGGEVNQQSGYSVAIEDNRLAVGVPNSNGASGMWTGAVKIYDWDGSKWVQWGANIDGEEQFDRSGTSVSLDGNRVAVGALLNSGNGEKAGHVRVYELKPLDEKDK